MNNVTNYVLRTIFGRKREAERAAKGCVDPRHPFSYQVVRVRESGGTQ